MLDQLTSVQLSEWEAYDTLDPIGTWREDYRTASLEALMVNIIQSLYHKENETPQTTTAIDFMPIWDKEARKVAEKPVQQSITDMKDLLMSLANSQNKKEERKKALQDRKPPKR